VQVLRVAMLRAMLPPARGVPPPQEGDGSGDHHSPRGVTPSPQLSPQVGDSVRVRMSPNPVPTINNRGELGAAPGLPIHCRTLCLHGGRMASPFRTVWGRKAGFSTAMNEAIPPSLLAADQTIDWFASIERCFKWNERKEQKMLRHDTRMASVGSLDAV
jgi:hypothetical protein